MKWDYSKTWGVNSRQYVGVPAKWITYIYENYGIYILNHSLGDMVFTINNSWVVNEYLITLILVLYY
jgi:hypothetical protein